MKIALVISSLGAGGAERVIITLANHWAARGWSVTLLTFEQPGTRPYYEVDARVALQQLGVLASARPLRALWRSLRRIAVLRGAIRSAQPDLVISFLAKINVTAVLATRGLDVGLIVSERNNPDRQALSPVWRWLRRRLYGLADRVVTPSAGVLRSLPMVSGARGRVIPNPVAFPPSARRTDRRTDRRTLVAVGRLDDQKGFDLLLQGFARIAGEHPDWELVIWGEGDERRALEALRDALGLAGRVRMPGLTGHPGQWVEDAAMFVLSSRFESFGNVVAEAMAAGLPVVVTDCPWGPGEIVRHDVDGWLVPPEDVAALARGLAALMADPGLRARLGAAAQRNVQRFDRANVMAMWDQLVVDVRSGNADPAPERADPAEARDATTRARTSPGSSAGRGLAAKRALDLIGALSGLALIAPVLVALAVAVRIGLGTPVLFRQQRPGLGGRPFALLKFRTMTDARDGAGHLLPDDQRLTPLGRLLRRTSLDELPELINVLEGDMSLVGPRPLLMEYLPHYTREQARRHEVRPGLTGWAAVHGRNATSWEQRLQHDVWYVDHRSLALDAKILLITVVKVLKQEGIAPEGQATMPRFDETLGKEKV